MLRSACANAQADLGFCCPHISEDRFSQLAAPTIFSFDRCPETCICYGLAMDCNNVPLNRSVSLTITPSVRWLDVSRNPTAFRSIHVHEDYISNLIHFNASHCKIVKLNFGLLKPLRNLHTLDIRYNNLITVESNTFVSQSRLRILLLEGNFDWLTFEPEAFLGLSALRHIQLSDLMIERFQKRAFRSLQLEVLELSRNAIRFIDENVFEMLQVNKLYLTHSSIESFSKAMFKGIESVSTIVTDSYQFCCIRPDILSEENCHPQKDEFSSCEDLIRSETLRTVIWIIGLLSLLGNGLALMYRVTYDRERLKLAYGIFVSNLCVSDFLIGAYMIIIASADVHFRGGYIFSSESWKQGRLCNFAGILSAFSNKASVLIMCLITMDRIRVIRYPFGRIRTKPRTAFIGVSLVWVTSAIIAAIPIMYTGEYYPNSGVCLSVPLTRDKPPGWAYFIALFIVLYCITFVLIVLGQMLVYRKTKQIGTMVASMRTQRTNELRVARNILWLVTTDCLCWLPVCIVGRPFTVIIVLFKNVFSSYFPAGAGC